MNKFIKKIKSKKGESFAEVMMAALVAALGTVLFTTMLNASFMILDKEQQQYADFINNKNDFEVTMESAETHNKTVTITNDPVAFTFKENAYAKVYVRDYGDYTFQRFEVVSWEE